MPFHPVMPVKETSIIISGTAKMRLYHTGKLEIREPDIRIGRKNADFGQGFYLTPDLEFTMRWASTASVVNEYELNENGLTVLRFVRDAEWFRYIFDNRRARDTAISDLVIGPIANDTIFDTYGIISSGFLKTEDAMKLLMIGPEYTQVAIKTEKAASRLRWIRSFHIDKMDAEARKEEQDAFSEAFAEITEEILKQHADTEMHGGTSGTLR